MHATAELNPYERELFYGYPYVVGRIAGRPIRAPLLMLPIRVEAEGSSLLVCPDDETLRMNTLQFSTETDTAARELALKRLIERVPAFPIDDVAAQVLKDDLARELPDLQIKAALDGRLTEPPEMPNSGNYLELIDQAAVFVAPKTGYFLVSDLEAMENNDCEDIDKTALGVLLSGAGDELQAEFEEGEEDRRPIYYPFQSNRSQRRVALLLDDDNTRLIRIEGPPGTGKSQTIANLACHAAAKGMTVLITSQKEQALHIVDEKLRELGLAQIPMTLLRHDASSRRELRDRLENIQKDTVSAEAESVLEGEARAFSEAKADYGSVALEFEKAVEAEHEYAQACGELEGARGIGRLVQSWRFARTRRRLNRNSPRMTDEVSEDATTLRSDALDQAVAVLEAKEKQTVSTAQRRQRQQIKEFSALLKKDQSSHKNFSIFDRLKSEPERADMLLGLLPVWIMAPDDVARLFPCRAGLFDVVIVDEASQVDLPSIAPVLFRAKKAVISGDTKQMQPQRFRFVSHTVANEAWVQNKVNEVDPDEWFHPIKQSLLTLAAIRAEEDNLLDEHYRSMPPIISFSNDRWYGGRLRIMTDETRKKFGGPAQPIIELHHVAEARITNDSQENLVEAQSLVLTLKKLMEDPAYASASFGVICLFEEQVNLIQELVVREIDREVWEQHDLVVVNPDGFQGDERDVVLYSLSFDNDVMSRAALSARQQQSEHVQGMLNVAFTRARDEIHIFHSAPIDEFKFAEGKSGALTDWLEHCLKSQNAGRQRRSTDRAAKSDSLFEAEVADLLLSRGYKVTQQYPSCGFFIDMVVETEQQRLAVECDGEPYHLDEHGTLKWEDLERQAVLERAGWNVVRIPYRRWKEQGVAALKSIDDWFSTDDNSKDPAPDDRDADDQNLDEIYVSGEEKAILEALREGLRTEEELLRKAREQLGFSRLGNRIRTQLLAAVRSLEQRKFLTAEDGEYFLIGTAKDATFHVRTSISRRGTSRHRTLYHTTCTECGKPASVPFKPSAGWPVRCRRCYASRR